MIYDEVFLPYDGGPAVQEAELKIARQPRECTPDYVELENGRLLLPQSRFDDLKEFIGGGLAERGARRRARPRGAPAPERVSGRP